MTLKYCSGKVRDLVRLFYYVERYKTRASIRITSDLSSTASA